MKTRFTFLVVVLAASLFAAAQQPPTVTAQPNTIYVSAEGHFDAEPDTARIQFNISAQENKARAAYDRAAAITEQIREMLRSNGIDVKQAQFGFLSLDPVYDYRNPKRKIIAYRVYSNVTLKLKDFSKIGPILQQLVDTDITSNQTLTYSLENMDAAKNHAVEDAYRRARQEAETLAKASGRTLGDLSYGAIDTLEAVPVRPVMYQMRAMAAVENAAPNEEFTPQQTNVTARVTAIFALK